MESSSLTHGESVILEYVTKQFLVAQPKLAETITAETSLVRSGVLDSFGIYTVVMFVEEQFGISIDDDEAIPEYFDSVSTIARFVSRKQSQLASGAAGSA